MNLPLNGVTDHHRINEIVWMIHRKDDRSFRDVGGSLNPDLPKKAIDPKAYESSKEKITQRGRARHETILTSRPLQ